MLNINGPDNKINCYLQWFQKVFVVNYYFEIIEISNEVYVQAGQIL